MVSPPRDTTGPGTGGTAARGALRPSLVRDTVRLHRTGLIAWVVGGGLTMTGMAAAIGREMSDFPGGARALAASIAVGAEAMRPLRWPAERLDTLGGYLTYHNVVLFNLMLAIYGAVQGVRDTRGSEEAGSADLIVSAGHSRVAIIRDRALGFVLVATAIAIGLALGVAAGLWIGAEPDLVGSLVTMGTTGIVALVGYGLGMLLGQLLGTARVAAGFGSALLTGIYVFSNVVDPGDPAGPLLAISPFHWANQSRALVPGIGLDPWGTAALVGMAVLLAVLATVAFSHRDLGAPLVHAPRRSGSAKPVRRLPHLMLGSPGSAAVRRGWRSSLVWASCTFALAIMFAWLQPAVMDLWDEFAFMWELTGASPEISLAVTYWSFAGDVLAPILAAYVITQSSGWVADLAQGRVELVLSTPVSWTGLVLGRMVGALAGVAAVTLGGVGGLWLGALGVGSELEFARVVRLVAVGLLFGAAVAGVAAIAVVTLRRTVVVTVMALVVAASYLVGYLVPVFGWPDWLTRASVFWAFGHPYLQLPPGAGLAILLTLAVGGTAAAAALAERSDKVP